MIGPLMKKRCTEYSKQISSIRIPFFMMFELRCDTIRKTMVRKKLFFTLHAKIIKGMEQGTLISEDVKEFDGFGHLLRIMIAMRQSVIRVKVLRFGKNRIIKAE